MAIIALAVVVAISAAPGAVEAGSDEPPPPPVTIAPEFLPESANLSDCVGLVERPGCGSKARGGWRQTAVFAAIAVGLGVIFWRVSLGVRRNRGAADADAAVAGTATDSTTDTTTETGRAPS